MYKILDQSKFSTFQRLIRVTGWVLNFFRKLKQKKGEARGDGLEAADLADAEICWIENIQRDLVNDTRFEKRKKTMGLFTDKADLPRDI